MKIIIDLPEEQYSLIMQSDRNSAALFTDKEAMMYAIKNGTPLDNLKTKLKDYITRSPYINGFLNCCRLKDDVMWIFDQYKEDLEVSDDK